MLLKHRRLVSLAFTVLMLTAFLLLLVVVAPTVKGAVLYVSGDPTPAEQLVLEYINRARSDPVAEGQRLGIDIHEGLSDPSLVGPRPPLAMNSILLGIAQAHSQDMYNLNYFSHDDPNGTTPYDRMIHAGYDYLLAGENMAAGGTEATAAELEDLMMIDAGTPGRPHRVNLLDLRNPYPCGDPPCAYSEVGIGYYERATPNGIGLGSLITEDFGAANTGPFLLGVVYNDQNHNNFYDIGEGLAGVKITPSSGGYYAISSSSGGYTIPIGTFGTITVTSSGPTFAPITKTVTLNGANIKLDFTASAQITSSATTSVQTSSTSTVVTTSSTVIMTSSTTTTSAVNRPSITLNPISGPVGSTVSVTGSGFSSGDSTCSLSGNSVGASYCSISGGTVTASFAVANVVVGSYSVAVTGSPAGDSAFAIFTVSLFTSQTTTSTSTSTTLTSTQTTQIITTTSYTTSSSTSQETTATNTQTSTVSTQTSTTNTPTTAPDFALYASSDAINLAQASTGNLVVSVQSIGSFDQQILLQATGLPDGVEISFSPNPVRPLQGGTMNSKATLAVTRSVRTGTYSFTITATSASTTKKIPLSLRVSGCLIATATFDSELAPEVQFLRDFRDYKILQTFAGTSFMVAFNTWYYSFSPGVAQYESINPPMRVFVKIMIYPLIWVLQIGSVVFDLFSFNYEIAAVFCGITISALLGTIYLAGPMLLARRKLSAKTRRVTGMFERASFFAFVGSLIIVALSEALKAETFMAVGSSIVVLSTMTNSALLTWRTVITHLRTKALHGNPHRCSRGVAPATPAQDVGFKEANLSQVKTCASTMSLRICLFSNNMSIVSQV
jgi:hypothetical protein